MGMWAKGNEPLCCLKSIRIQWFQSSVRTSQWVCGLLGSLEDTSKLNVLAYAQSEPEEH